MMIAGAVGGGRRYCKAIVGAMVMTGVVAAAAVAATLRRRSRRCQHHRGRKSCEHILQLLLLLGVQIAEKTRKVSRCSSQSAMAAAAHNVCF